jgi:hypothetical protein
MMDLRTELEKYPRHVLIEWILIRGFSFFPEELAGIHARMNPKLADLAREIQRLQDERTRRPPTAKMQSAAELAKLVKVR